MQKEKYVMLGHSHSLGDLIEIIHARNGVLTKIVQNVEETVDKSRPLLKERLAKLHDREFNHNRVNGFTDVCVQPIDEFMPSEDEKYIVGFTGYKMSRLVEYVTQYYDIEFISLIHPSAIVSPDANISSGCIIQAGAIIGSGVKLNEYTCVNKGVNIDSNTTVEKFSTLAPGTIIGRNVSIGIGVFLGIGSIVLDEIEVHNHSVIAAGATVINNVPSNTLVAGIPAVIKKTKLKPNLS